MFLISLRRLTAVECGDGDGGCEGARAYYQVTASGEALQGPSFSGKSGGCYVNREGLGVGVFMFQIKSRIAEIGGKMAGRSMLQLLAS